MLQSQKVIIVKISFQLTIDETELYMLFFEKISQVPLQHE